MDEATRPFLSYSQQA